MWTWLASLPQLAQIVLPVSIFIVILLISIFGKATFNLKKKTFGFGKNKGRSCKDCMILTFSKREEFEIKIRKLENSILKDQMNFAEHKIDSVTYGLLQDYRNHLKEKRTDDVDYEREHRETVLYEEVIKISLQQCKDEIRRSFKENGFHELSGVEFQAYVKNKTQDLLARARGYMLHRYPSTGMIISVDERIDRLNEASIEDIVFDIYIHSKETRIKVIKEIDKLENEFISSIHELVGLEEEEYAKI